MKKTPLQLLNGLRDHLQANLLGQDHLMDRVCSVLQRGELGLAHPGRPKGSFLLIGPTGVGKTEMASCFTEYLFGAGHLCRFDMSEFQNQESVALMLGANSTESGMLGRAVERTGKGTLLFDEMEKAHPLILDLFLQILDAGRITTANGQTLDLSHYYVVFTSNIGASEIMRMEQSSFTTVERTALRKVDQALRPELVGRIQERLVFARLDYIVQRKIAEQMIELEVNRLAALGHTVTYSTQDLEQIIRDGFDKYLGARPLRRAVERWVQDSAAHRLLKAS